VANAQTEKIRVLRIIARMNVGGPAVQISGLMRHFDQERFNQRLITGYCGVDEADYLDTSATDIPVTRIEGLGKSISLTSDLRAFLSIVKIIREFKPDISHTHTAKAGGLGRIASLVSGQRSVRIHTFHGHLLHGYFSPLKTKLVILIEKVLALSTNRIFAVGQKVADDLVAARIAPRRKFFIMVPGIELGQLPNREKARDTLGLSKDLTYCSFIGRITKIKRPDRFLEVVRIVSAKVPLQFVVAGHGDLFDEIKTESQRENLPITFLGWRSDIENILMASDITVLTSDNEGMPISIIQSGMAGVPAVSTNVGSVSSIIEDGKTGFLTSNKAPAIAEKLVLLYREPELRLALGDAAKEKTLREFGVMRLVADHEIQYLEALSQH